MGDPKIYRCMECRGFWLEQDVKPESFLSGMVLVCPQDGALVVDATYTPAGKRFLEAKEKEQEDANQI